MYYVRPYINCAGAAGDGEDGGRRGWAGRAAAVGCGVRGGDEEGEEGDRGSARGDGAAAQLQRRQLHRYSEHPVSPVSRSVPCLFLSVLRMACVCRLRILSHPPSEQTVKAIPVVRSEIKVQINSYNIFWL